MHTLPIQIRFNDADAMGHVNNAVIMEYYDLGKAAYFTSIGLVPDQGDFTVVIVHYEVDFMSQIRNHDNIQVCTNISRIGNKSIEVVQRVENIDTQEVCSMCKTIMSGYSRITNSSAVIPESIKERIRQGESQ